jgi:hypothetical protein
MPIPISYSYRNLLARRLTTFLTAAGMALVVFVFAAVLMLSEGLRRTLVATGSFDNVVVLRAGSESEPVGRESGAHPAVRLILSPDAERHHPPPIQGYKYRFEPNGGSPSGRKIRGADGYDSLRLKKTRGG